MPTKYTSASANISPCERFRFLLTREWDARLPACAFIGLNPSTADASKDDPTIRRCVDFAARWGYGKLHMLNLVAYRSTDPAAMFSWLEKNGPLEWLRTNVTEALTTFEKSDIVIAAWGAPGSKLGDFKKVMIDAAGDKLYSLATTKSGEPGHPLYLKKDLRATRYPEIANG